MLNNSEISRSWLLVNAANETALESSLSSETDEVILDLEDAVAPRDKQTARLRVTQFLNHGGQAWVRINDASSEYWSADCRALAGAAGLRGVVLAKTEGGNHLWDTSSRLGSNTPIIALIETARGIARVHDIAAQRPCFRIAFGINDYTLDTGADNDPLALAYARSQLVVASRAAHIPGPIDGPTREPDDLVKATTLTRKMGMTGKLALNAADVDTINTVLSPSPVDIRWATGFISEYNDRGATPTDGSDLPHLHRAKSLLDKAELFGLIHESRTGSDLLS